VALAGLSFSPCLIASVVKEEDSDITRLLIVVQFAKGEPRVRLRAGKQQVLRSAQDDNS
jgi:hypothetical protein